MTSCEPFPFRAHNCVPRRQSSSNISRDRKSHFKLRQKTSVGMAWILQWKENASGKNVQWTNAIRNFCWRHPCLQRKSVAAKNAELTIFIATNKRATVRSSLNFYTFVFSGKFPQYRPLFRPFWSGCSEHPSELFGTDGPFAIRSHSLIMKIQSNVG
jgi:hypothetical protein